MFTTRDLATDEFQKIAIAIVVAGRLLKSSDSVKQQIQSTNHLYWVLMPRLEAGQLIFNNRGFIYKLKGEYDRALEDYNQAILLNPSYANAYNNRGVIYRIRGEYERAIEDYNEAIWLDSNIPAFFYNRAIAYTEKQDFDRAIADFEVVLRFNDKNALAL